MRYLLKNAVPLLILMLATVACADNVVYHSYRYVAGKEWDRDNALTFDVQITDSVPMRYHLYVQIRNRMDYPYRNLLLLVSHNLQDSSVVVTDTVRCTLADETGRWEGDGLGGLFQIDFNVNEYVAHYPAGVRTVKVVHGMEDQTLVGINDVGIRIEK
ncbi:Gliding motility lipoprotein GldH [termite gut metagenome]|uniref:Gliding motility lipoprotein GldH n=1 Tax=termite gut metagenome TaxID=433724 RepID=A0A5J4SND5_9ZZZZ